MTIHDFQMERLGFQSGTEGLLLGLGDRNHGTALNGLQHWRGRKSQNDHHLTRLSLVVLVHALRKNTRGNIVFSPGSLVAVHCAL